MGMPIAIIGAKFIEHKKIGLDIHIPYRNCSRRCGEKRACKPGFHFGRWRWWRLLELFFRKRLSGSKENCDKKKEEQNSSENQLNLPPCGKKKGSGFFLCLRPVYQLTA